MEAGKEAAALKLKASGLPVQVKVSLQPPSPHFHLPRVSIRF